MSVSGIGSSGLADMLLQMQQKMKTAFSNADTDADGSLSKTEFSAFDAAMRADAPQGANGAQGSGAPSADEIFSKMDTDGDGAVSQAEMEAFRPPMSSDGMSALLQSQETDTSGSSALDLTSLLTDGGASLLAGLLQQMLGAYQQSGTSTSELLSSVTGSTSVEA